MKLWEVLKELEENPNKVFKCAYMRLTLESDMYQFINVNTQERTFYMGKDNDWQEVKQPVPWQEAIEAWVSKKNISCTYLGSNTKYKDTILDDINGLGITRGELIHGTWYIED